MSAYLTTLQKQRKIIRMILEFPKKATKKIGKPKQCVNP